MAACIILIGYRGTGKTTVARILAQRLHYDWVDADDQIESQAGCSIRDIFATEGEAGFRRREAEVVQQLVTRPDTVIAMGGGAVLSSANRQAMQRGTVVWLRASAETLARRLAEDQTTGTRRPALSNLSADEEIRELLARRAPLYHECADYEVQTEQKTPHQVADQVVSLLGESV